MMSRRRNIPVARWKLVAVAMFGMATVSLTLPAQTGGAQQRAPLVAPARAVTARVTGIAFDSVAMEPLVGAMVQLVSIDDPSRIRSTMSDSVGDYAIDSVTPGGYLMGFFHSRLDALGIDGSLLQLDLRDGGDVRTAVAIPSARTIVTLRCGPDTTGLAPGLFIGVVRSARSDALAGPARVRAQWSELLVSPTGAVQRQNPAHYVNSAETGEFAICGIPTNVPITARAFVGTDSSGFVELEIPRNGLLVRDMYIGATDVARGNGRVRGVVRNDNGQPVSGARVAVLGGGANTTTGAGGQFALQAVPSGTYTIEARALGYNQTRSTVDVMEDEESTANLTMGVFVPTVDTMRVKADRNASVPLAEFERRRKTGFGHFIDEAKLEDMKPLYMADIFRSTPGMNIMPGTSMADRVLMRSSGSGGSCIPAIFLNGLMVITVDGNLDAILNPRDVRAVEIYNRTASVPIQFQTRTGCGSIVIWTGARRPAESKR